MSREWAKFTGKYENPAEIHNEIYSRHNAIFYYNILKVYWKTLWIELTSDAEYFEN